MDVIDSTTNCQKDIDNNALNTENEDNSCLDDFEENKDWYYMPDSVLLNIFQYLTSKELATVAEVCKSWHRVSRDEFLWKDLFYRTYKIDPNIGIMPGKTSWLEEFKRLTYHIPLLETEVLKEHSHQVLHVSFSHNGKMFATCSKDGYIFVWSSEYPVSIKYLHDMKTYNWKYTQFSQFNPTDTLLLVCGVNFSTPNTTSGEIAIFTLTSSFDLQYRVMNKPYDIFGTWYSEHYFIYGNVFTLEHLVSASFLMVQKIHERNKCSFLIEELFRFYSGNASSIRAIMVANCVTSVPNKLKEEEGQPSSSNTDEKSKSSLNLKDNLPTASDEGCEELEKPVVLRHASSRLQYSTLEGGFMNWKKLGDGFDYANPIQYNQEYRQVEQEKKVQENEESEYSQKEEEEEEVEEEEEEEEAKKIEPEKSSAMNSEELQNTFTKYLIFTTGSKTFTPHQVGFKKIEHDYLPTPHCTQKFVFDFVHSSTNWSNYESVADKFDKIDHLIDLHGHIIGMRLSPDHRYLYVNTRPWPRGYVITNPLQPPPIAQEIDIHVIDLVTLKEVGTMLRAHKAYTPNNECFFIFLDVCNEYVASGAEDKHGYLWDRHYGVCLAKFPHSDVVNSVAFNPCDPEMLVTTSDDYTVKIWRSRAMVRALGLNEDVYHRGMEVRNRRKFRKSNCNVD